MNDDPQKTAEQADAEDNDPWMSFGSYSEADIAAARTLLEQAGITFYVGPDGFPGEPPSSTPHHLWVHDDHIARAEAILFPYFRSRAQTPI
jgi:hypothetical protein